MTAWSPLWAPTSSNIGRSSRFFHCYNLQKICNASVISYPTTPQTRRCTTLWNLYVRKIACPVRCGSFAGRWTLQNPDTWLTAAAILNKIKYMYADYNLVLGLPLWVNSIFDIVCKLHKSGPKNNAIGVCLWRMSMDIRYIETNGRPIRRTKSVWWSESDLTAIRWVWLSAPYVQWSSSLRGSANPSLKYLNSKLGIGQTDRHRWGWIAECRGLKCKSAFESWWGR